MRKNQLYILLVLNFFLVSCGFGEWDTTLYVQKIEGTSKVLYKYDSWGGRDSNDSGYILLDSTETFKVPRDKKKLSFSYLKEIPNKDYIHGVSFDTPDYKNITIEKESFFTPIEIMNIKRENINIKIDIYKHSSFQSRSSGFKKYTFESFKETRDSLFFYNLEYACADDETLESLKFKKRNIVISQNSDKQVKAIDINDLRISDNNNEIISNRTYSLIPKNTIKSDSFSDYGIFKEAITKKD